MGQAKYASPHFSSLDPAAASIQPVSSLLPLLPHFPTTSSVIRRLHNKKQRTGAWSQISSTLHRIPGGNEAKFSCPRATLIQSRKKSARFLWELWEKGEDREGFARADEVLGEDGKQARRMGSTRREG